MKLFTALFALVCACSFAQGVRVDPTPAMTTNGARSGYPQVLAIPNATIQVCQSPANGVPCTNVATTYMDASLTVACPNNAQVVLAGTTTCVSTSDAQGNFGFWLPSGTYTYIVTRPDGTVDGPFPITAAGAIPAVLPVVSGGTGLSTLGSALQVLRTALAGTSLQYAQPNTISPTDGFSFSISPGASLSIGSNLISLTSCPAGMAVSDYLYISGGVGTAEVVPVTATTCAPGGGAGSITVTTANTHSGPYTITSATSGINEALNYASSLQNSVVYIPPGLYGIRAAVVIPSKQQLTGAGPGLTTIQIINNALNTSAAWGQGVSGQVCAVCFAQNATASMLKDLTVDANGANQTYIFYSDVMMWNNSHSRIENVIVKNHPLGGTGSSIAILNNPGVQGPNVDNQVIRASVIDIPGCTVPNGQGAYYVEGTGNKVVDSYAVNFCDAAYVISDANNSGVYDSVADVGSGQMGTSTFSIEGATNATFQGDKALGSGTNGNFACFGVASAGTTQAIGSILTGDTCQHANIGIQVGVNLSSTLTVNDTTVAGFIALSPSQYGVNLSQYVNRFTMTGGNITNAGTDGIAITSMGTNVVGPVTINGVQINNSGNGIFATNNTSGAPVADLTVTNCILTNNAYSLFFTSGTISHANISGNTFLNNSTATFSFANSFSIDSILGPNTSDSQLGWLPTGYTGNTLPACSSTFGVGYIQSVSNASTAVHGATFTQTGSNFVVGLCSQSGNWVVLYP